MSKSVSAKSALDLPLPGLGLRLDCYGTQSEITRLQTGNLYTDGFARNVSRTKAEVATESVKILDEPQHWSQLRRTRLEIAMIGIVEAITDKPLWYDKIWNQKIRDRWRHEIIRELSAIDTRYAEESREMRNGPFYWGEDIDQATADFIVEELQQKSTHEADLTSVLGLGGADVLRSDTLFSEEFRSDLKLSIDKLTAGPPNWHPGREGVIRDIVHPSMFPLKFGRTTIVADTIPLESSSYCAGQGLVIPEPLSSSGFSVKSQWLPAEVKGTAEEPYFASYINGLGERYEDLYISLGTLVRFSIPLWDRCIALQVENSPRRVSCNSENELWAVASEVAEEMPVASIQPDTTVAGHSEARSHLESLGSRKWDSSLWHKYQPRLIWPTPIRFPDWRAALEAEHVSPHKALISRHILKTALQVIVKIARIELSPEQPVFDGGDWHVEGLPNEHICATSIYYYDCKNVTNAKVSFRAGAHMGPCSYGQDDFVCLEHVYGTKLRDTAAVQEFAKVTTRQGRLIAFPNVFQHRIQPFELIDKTKPGHRGMVVLWLVNPQKRIISTANVPPQQPRAWQAMVDNLQQQHGISGAESRLKDRTEPMSLAEAEAIRLELMSERSLRQESLSSEAYPSTYSFCEH